MCLARWSLIPNFTDFVDLTKSTEKIKQWNLKNIQFCMIKAVVSTTTICNFQRMLVEEREVMTGIVQSAACRNKNLQLSKNAC
jgi:hypothetical protein